MAPDSNPASSLALLGASAVDRADCAGAVEARKEAVRAAIGAFFTRPRVIGRPGPRTWEASMERADELHRRHGGR